MNLREENLLPRKEKLSESLRNLCGALWYRYCQRFTFDYFSSSKL